VAGVRLAGPGRLRWADVLAELHRREIQTLLIEGGGTVAGSALEHGVVDKLVLFQAATVMGPGRSFSTGMRGRSLGRLLRLARIERRCVGPDVMVEGYVHRAD
jgi:diaminohydroxyphosphoribosylaminopyrimidine deaminase/5-amino-6-(5-phosphoribosylamino)uracil reductase